MGMGWSLLEVGRVNDSYVALTEALRINGLFQAWINLGNTFKAMSRISDALKCYRKAIDLNPNSADVYLNLGNVLNEEGEIGAAANAFAQYYQLKPIVQSSVFLSDVAPSCREAISGVSVPESAAFIPSYVSDAIPLGCT